MKINQFANLLLFCLIQLSSLVALMPHAAAQSVSTSEVGIGLGATNYKGDISPNYRFLNNRPAITAFYKKDISTPIALRASLLAGMTRAKDEDVERPVHQLRQAEMQTNLIELSVGIDYKFLDYYDQRQHIRWSPYFFVGAAAANYSNKVLLSNNRTKPFENGFIFSIPAGIGVKYALSYHWNLGVEVGARAAILKSGDRFDYLRNKTTHASNPPPTLPYANPYDNDWYFYNGISLSYTFYKLLCPPVYKNNKNLLK